MTTTGTIRTAACAVAATVGLALVSGATADAKPGSVRVNGTCSKASVAKLKLSPEEGRIAVEFEVDQNRSGVRWRVRVRHNGALAFSGARRTAGPSGSFTVRKLVPNAVGRDKITVRATRNGETCTARASL